MCRHEEWMVDFPECGVRVHQLGNVASVAYQYISASAATEYIEIEWQDVLEMVTEEGLYFIVYSKMIEYM